MFACGVFASNAKIGQRFREHLEFVAVRLLSFHVILYARFVEIDRIFDAKSSVIQVKCAPAIFELLIFENPPNTRLSSIFEVVFYSQNFYAL